MVSQNKAILPADINQCFGKMKEPLDSSYQSNTLSVIMIVKNEAKNIWGAINSFLPFADEIIINDTGSDDDTITIIQELQELDDYIGKIKYFRSEWKDDFALARNHSKNSAASSWLIWLDADDRILPEEVEKFNKLKTAPLDRIFGFQIINTQSGMPFGTRFMQCRMFPNHPDLYFERSIHEQIMFSAARLGLHCIYTDTTIHHTGYEDKEIQKEKARRNIKLSENESDLIGIDPAFTPLNSR